MNKDLEDIKNEYFQMAEKIGAPQKYVYFHDSRKDNGSAHVEFDGKRYWYIATDRGEATDQKFTFDKNELLYWLVANLTWHIAVDYERAHRVDGQDRRRIHFQKQIDLLKAINPSWGEQKRKELEHHLFNDKNEPRHL